MARRGHRWFAAVYDLLNRSAERRLLGPIRARLLGALRGRVLARVFHITRLSLSARS
jgi:hypothetical protein